ncbi:MAG: hypothetical protein RL654_1130 [Pseudomonadota bacterium]|jgi:hypothetical protein
MSSMMIMSARRPLAVLSLLSAALLTAGCGGGDEAGGTDPQAAESARATALATRVPAERTWRAGQLLENAGTEVVAYKAGMADDTGTVIAVFVQKIGSRYQLQAVRGTPGSASTSSAWTAPVVISGAVDPAMDPGKGSWDLGLSVASGGRAYATWFVRRACTATTYVATPSATCNVLYGAAFDGSNWGVPELIADSPRHWGAPVPRINDSGDIAVLHEGWVAPGSTLGTQRVAVAARLQGQSSFARSVFADWPLQAGTTLGNDVDLQLDAARNLIVAGRSVRAGTGDIIARRGMVGSTFRTPEVIDAGSADARFLGLATGPGGRSFVQWRQALAGSTVPVIWGAASASATSTWAARNLGASASADAGWLQAPSSGAWAGSGLFHATPCQRTPWLGGALAWGTAQALPSGCEVWHASTARRAQASDGQLLWLAQDGRWSSHDAIANRITKPLAASGSSNAADFLFGLPVASLTSARLFGANLGNATLLISSTGIGALVTRGTLATLPSASAPGGVNGAVYSLWGWFLK